MSRIPIAAIPDLLRLLAATLGSVTGDPAHAAKGSAIANSLGLAATLVERGEESADALHQLTSALHGMTTGGGERSASEWHDFTKQVDDAHAALPPLQPATPPPSV